MPTSDIANALRCLEEKIAAISPDVTPQEHQQRVADRISGANPRLLVYHGLGTGKSLAAILAAEQAGGDYGIVAPAALRQNFNKEIEKFTKGSNPEVMSYTGLGMGKQFAKQPETLIVDEAHRLRNPSGNANKAIANQASKAKRLMLLTGSPIVNSPTDLAAPISLLNNINLSPEKFEEDFIDYKKVSPGFFASLRGVTAGEKPDIKNEAKLRELLKGKVDYQPSKTPEGVSVNEEIVDAPMSAYQERIQNAIRKKIPLKFLWKLDKEFPLSRNESTKLNAFLSGLRQVSLSTQPFRADKDPLKSFEQSGKLTAAMTRLKDLLSSDPRKKAIIYSNFVQSGLDPYAAALTRDKIPYGYFHGGISEAARKKAVNEYNAGKLKALLIGPAGAEGLSTKGTSLIQLLDPYWNETRSNQAQGRGLRFDSHTGLPEELKDVKVQKFISKGQQPSTLMRWLGAKPVRTGDEMLQSMAARKEELNERFKKLLREEGSKRE